MQPLQTAVIPSDAVVKTVTVHESEFEVQVLFEKMNTQSSLMAQRLAWYQAQGYGSTNDYPNGSYGPYYQDTTVIRFWKSQQDAETWNQLTRAVHQACGIAADEVPVVIVPV